MDEFFQNLREIQKKERSLSGLSPVGEDFYQQISNYFNKLMKRIDNNPFSFESYLLRDAQRIVVEICERREHKITNSAVMNVQRSYQIFKDTVEDVKPNIPQNSTPEEQKLYMDLYRNLGRYREELRSPLRSYSSKNKKSSDSSSKAINRQLQADAGDILDIPDKSNDVDGKIPYNSEVHISKNIRESKKIREQPSFRDEIPPEIQDEIYREFGKEPSRQDFQGSKSSSKEIKDSGINATDSHSSNGELENLPGTGSGGSGSFSSGNIPETNKTSTEVLMILDEIPSIMGVDSKVYGPFYPGDIITMPKPNARILIKNHKGKSIQRYK
ncbi:MAG: hypothetical protein HVN35_04110 [Methanobacteriaceae archaeon]|nr:hypothetical protein [Methanobacteriaceae archaeon]